MPVIERSLEDLLGDPDDNARDIDAFTRDARAMAARMEGLMKKYPDKFIAFYQGKVRASSKDMKRLFTRMDRLGIPRAHSVVEFIPAHHRDLIL